MKKLLFLFVLIEKYKNIFNIEEYTIQVTLLEQIFNIFAKEMDNNESSSNLEKIDINDFYNKLMNNLCWLKWKEI